ncbi:MAG: ABC transporter ATP-binding protein, partial [Oscillospiraceae bacterium]|nr:ABC transporter ATP-binding protein [Oscillospiraceae bacterium]
MTKGVIRNAPGVNQNPNKHQSNKIDRKTAGHILLRLGKYVLQYWPLFLLAIVLTLCSNQLSLMGPRFSGEAIDAIADPAGVNFELVGESVVKMLICYIASALFSYLLAVLMIQISQKIVYTMRKQLFEKLTRLPVNYFDTHATGDIISRISYDIDTVNSSLSHDLVQVMTSLYTVIGSL